MNKTTVRNKLLFLSTAESRTPAI